MLHANAQSGATIIAIGPCTNLAVLETMRPGAFSQSSVVVMGGHFGELPESGLPQWGPAMDYNIQTDRPAATVVFERMNPLIVPLAVTLKVCLRRLELPALQAGGPLARLLALQAELHCGDNKMEQLARANTALPADILNFQYNSLACAAALGWDCVTIEEVPLAVGSLEGETLLNRDSAGLVYRVVTDVDAVRFSERWLETVVQL
ncbi:MAG: nucleoside hydrolase [Tepidiformaceae bacterium]